MFEIPAPAKINLSLQITGKRTDGFHEIVSIMQTISLADVLTFFPAATVSLECTEPALQSSDNLVLQAARLLRAEYRISEGCHIRLEKRIPVAAGLAGGSSDAAAAVKGLTRLWRINLDTVDELSMANRLGSDVPFLVHGGTSLIEGRGERVSPLPDPPLQWYVLARPRFPVSTASIFAALSDEHWSDGGLTRAMADRIRDGARIEMGVNDLQSTLFRLYPEAQRCYDHVAAITNLQALTSGSGPTVVGLCVSRATAKGAAAFLREKNYWAEIAHSGRTRV